MLNADLALYNDVKAKRSRRKANHTKEYEVEQEQNGFHFVAFVPMQGSVWKLDGLDRQPTNLGKLKSKVVFIWHLHSAADNFQEITIQIGWRSRVP